MPPVVLKTVGSPRGRYSFTDLPADIRVFLLGLVGCLLSYTISNWGKLDFGSLTPWLTSVVPGLLSMLLSVVTNTQQTIAVDSPRRS